MEKAKATVSGQLETAKTGRVVPILCGWDPLEKCRGKLESQGSRAAICLPKTGQRVDSWDFG